MKKIPWHGLVIVALLSVIAFCLLFIAQLGTGFSPGMPQGNCSVEGLLLDKSAFPPGTTMSSSEDFDDFAVASASHTFINLDRGVSANHSVEYLTASFAAWQTYLEKSTIFGRTAYNDSWLEPSEMKFSSRTANQYRFACTNDTVVGPRCILHARYGRHFVGFRSSLSQDFTIRDLAPLLEQIDNGMAKCLRK